MKVVRGITNHGIGNLSGSSRLGIWRRNLDVEMANWWLFDKTAMAGTGGGMPAILTRGQTMYELSNHLGNVLVTVSDRKVQVQDGTSGTTAYYTADVVTATDYYPFGMDMPGRKFGADARYGFNGKERDKDMHSLTAYDYGFRIYNPAIGKFLSVDPLTKDYPWYTPYQFAGNKPIRCIDIDGLEEFWGFLIGDGFAMSMLQTPCGREIAESFYKNVKGTLDGFVPFFKNLGKGGQSMNYEERVKWGLSPVTAGLSPQGAEAANQLFTQLAEAPEAILVAVFDHYEKMIRGAIDGDCGEIGNVIFEIASLAIPGDEALRLLKTGVRSFKRAELAEVVIDVGKKIDVSKFHLPKTKGHWQGSIGNSKWFSDIPEVNAITNYEPIPFVNGVADFSKWSIATFEVNGLTGASGDFRKIYQYMKDNLGFKSQNAAKKWLKENNLTPHHAGGNKIEIVPTDLHKVPHQGGAAELRNRGNN